MPTGHEPNILRGGVGDSSKLSYQDNLVIWRAQVMDRLQDRKDDNLILAVVSAYSVIESKRVNAKAKNEAYQWAQDFIVNADDDDQIDQNNALFRYFNIS
jgi:hypothetical protein